MIVVSIFVGPGWLLEQQGSLHKAGSTKMQKIITRTAGIDTSKAKLDIALHAGECWQVANAASGWRSLAKKLAEAGAIRVWSRCSPLSRTESPAILQAPPKRSPPRYPSPAWARNSPNRAKPTKDIDNL